MANGAVDVVNALVDDSMFGHYRDHWRPYHEIQASVSCKKVQISDRPQRSKINFVSRKLPFSAFDAVIVLTISCPRNPSLQPSCLLECHT